MDWIFLVYFEQIYVSQDLKLPISKLKVSGTFLWLFSTHERKQPLNVIPLRSWREQSRPMD